MTDELKQWEYDKGYAKGQIDILEKIKAEMIKNLWNGDLDEIQEAFNQGVSKSILILDNHIAELKGE